MGTYRTVPPDLSGEASVVGRQSKKAWVKISGDVSSISLAIHHSLAHDNQLFLMRGNRSLFTCHIQAGSSHHLLIQFQKSVF
jgi:hypothetical protein